MGCCAELLKPVEIPQVQFLDIYCGTDRGRVNATDHVGLLGFADFLGHLCQSQVPGVPESPGVSLPGDSEPVDSANSSQWLVDINIPTEDRV